MKFEERTYFKLCRTYVSTEIIGEYRTCNSSFASPRGFILDYEINEITRSVPGSLGIFVFGKQSDAKRYIDELNLPHTNHPIFECHVIGPVTKTNIRISSFATFPIHDTHLSRKRRLKQVRDKVTYKLDIVPAPDGTFLVGAVKPFRKIELRA